MGHHAATRRAAGQGRILARRKIGGRGSFWAGSDLVARVAPLAREERLAMLLDGAPPRKVALALRHRYIALALSVNIPGNGVIGGGGGIMLMEGLSGIFAPVPTLLAIVVAVSSVPLAVMLLGA